MNSQLLSHVSLALLLAMVTAFAALTPEQVAKLPAPSSQQIDFIGDIKPIFEAACVKCHGKGQQKGGFSLETHEAFLQGGDSGMAILSGHSAESLLIELVSGLNPQKAMPKKGSKLTPEQVGRLRAWIEQGASWPAGISFAKGRIENLHPRKPALPGETNSGGNPVDRLLAPYFAAHNFTPPKPVDDRLFMRRVCLDMIGLLPAPEKLEVFLNDSSPNKRERLVRQLLADNQRYAEHWLTFWNDLLRNDYKGTGYIDDGRKQITGWLFEALLENRPYNQFVAQLIDPGGEASGFISGIVWRGAVPASQLPPMQAAQSIAQVFMGVNLKCASCHDSFINDYTLADSYGLAAIYATNSLEVFECDKPAGRRAGAKFLYPELGEINGDLPGMQRSKQLAQILASKENGRVTRTIVNRLWAKFMGRGLVEPLDDMDQRAWNHDLLDWLAADLAESGYDLKHTMERILLSDAYALPSVDGAEGASARFVFRGPQLRRMTAEQFADALSSVAGVWNPAPDSDLEFTPDFTDSLATRPARRPLPSRARWIWANTPAADAVRTTNVFLRRSVLLPQIPEQATLLCASAVNLEVFINGQTVPLKRREKRKIHLLDIRPYLLKGENVFAVHLTHNFIRKQTAPQIVGVWIDCRLRTASATAGMRRDFASDGLWQASLEQAEGWERPHFKGAWPAAAEINDPSSWRESIERQLHTPLALATRFGHIRASLICADPLTAALGRPNREQIATVRQTAATTLQGLELANGKTLHQMLKRSAENLLADAGEADVTLAGSGSAGSDRFTEIAEETPASPADLIEAIFLRSLGRAPTSDELELAMNLVGSPATAGGVEDLLWSVAMLPEFQFIY